MEGRTLFLFPTEAEAAPFRTLRPDAAVAIIGVGIAEAAAGTAAQMVVTDPTRVVLCGIAGACDDRLSVGQAPMTAENCSRRRKRSYNGSKPSPEN